jgi:hypothetical protein
MVYPLAAAHRPTRGGFLMPEIGKNSSVLEQ